MATITLTPGTGVLTFTGLEGKTGNLLSAPTFPSGHGSMYIGIDYYSLEPTDVLDADLITPAITLAETLELTPAVTYERFLAAVLAYTLEIASPATPAAIRQGSLAEAVQFAQQLLAARSETAAETISLTPSPVVAQGILLAQSLGVGNVLTNVMTAQLAWLDQLVATDQLLTFFGRTITDGFTVAPSTAYARIVTASEAETVELTPTLAPQLIIRVDAPETIELTPAEALAWIFRPTVMDDVLVRTLYVAPTGSIVTWVTNTGTGATTEYTDYGFTSFAHWGRHYYGADAQGLYRLTGDTDAGTPIIAELQTAFLQFVGSRYAGFKALYLGVHGNGTMYVRIDTGDGASYTYEVMLQDMQTTKVQVGKGLRARYYAFTLLSTGQDFDLDTIEFVPMVADRRV